MPLLDAYQGINEGGLDAFVAKINPSGVTGAQLLYSTYLGGSGDDVGYGVAVDSSPDAYVTGSTTSTDFNAGTTGTDSHYRPRTVAERTPSSQNSEYPAPAPAAPHSRSSDLLYLSRRRGNGRRDRGHGGQ